MEAHDAGVRSEYTPKVGCPRSQASNAPKVRVEPSISQDLLSRGSNVSGNSVKIEPSTSSRRGGRKKKNGRMDSRPNNRGDKKTRNGGGGQRTLVLPHSKLTIRRIYDVEKFGSAEQMTELVREIFKSASTTLAENTVPSPTEYSVVLDEASLERCCKKPTDEKKLVEEREQPQDLQPQITLIDNVNEPSSENTAVAKEIEPNTENATETNEPGSPEENIKENIHILITVKTLYLTPPRKSRRRGIITGNIYLVLNPTIKSTPYTKMSNFERSKTVATARLALQSFQTILASSADNIPTTPPIILERSPNQKTFYPDKPNRNFTYRQSMLEGSIFNTEDYKTFMEQRLKFQEDLKNRPKPQPGGGFLDTVTSTIISKEDSKEEKKDLPQQTVSALILYLQKKKEMASYSKKKSAMKLASSKSSKRKKKKDIKGSLAQGGGGGKSKNDFKKKGGSNVSSSTGTGSNAANPMTITPKAILKS